MKVITDAQRIDEMFARGTVTDGFPSADELKKKLMSGERMRIYIGFDPTGVSIHLGHAKNLIFLEELRQLGHEVIMLFGDFTAMIGDPSDKKATRKQLTAAEVKVNVAGWVRQVKPLLDFDDKENPAAIRYNSEWLSKLSFAEVLDLASNFTVQQMLERDMFQKRLADKSPIHVHEFMYPLMQGYDSVAMDVDAELCGTDQIFNAMAGRTLVRRYKNKEKFVIALNLIANPATGELMSKSNGTGVFVDQPAESLFGAIMALPDPMIEPLFLNCTRIPIDEKAALMARGPRDAKAAVAFDIVKRFHGEAGAKTAQQSWESTFSKGGVPDEILTIPVSTKIVEDLIKGGVVSSKTDWRRLIDEGAVRLADGAKIEDPNFEPYSGMVIKIGKRRFVKFV